MRTGSARGPVAIVKRLFPVVMLSWLGLASMNPITESVVLADGSHVDRELADLLHFMQEETSLSRESSQTGEPSWLEVASSDVDEPEASEPERGASWQVVGATTSKGFPNDKVSVQCPWVSACGSRETR